MKKHLTVFALVVLSLVALPWHASVAVAPRSGPLAGAGGDTTKW